MYRRAKRTQQPVHMLQDLPAGVATAGQCIDGYHRASGKRSECQELTRQNFPCTAMTPIALPASRFTSGRSPRTEHQERFLSRPCAGGTMHILSSRITQATLLLSLVTTAQAAPSGTLFKRSDSDTKMIVPIVIIAVFLLLFAIVVISRRGWHTRMAHWTTNAASAFGPSTGVTSAADGSRELTAQQLAGNMTATSGDQAPGGGTAARPRRTRRNRRTPSQISTRSLPVYMKEPGELEVVIYRGPDDLEDAPPPTNVVMPSVAESGAESPDLSVDLSGVESRIYVPMPDSPHDMPLLAGDDILNHSQADMDMDNSRSNLIVPPRSLANRPSYDTLGSSEEGRHSPSSSPDIDPRGEAPPYFEVVAMDDLNPSPEPTTSEDGHQSPEPALARHSDSTRRRSGFLGLFQGRHGAPRPPVPPIPAESPSSSGHRREDSATSNISTPSNTRHARAQSRATMHRPSFSGSGSMFSVMSRSRSHLLDQANLTSPSMLSINSISSPLTHTLVKTEFTYPKTGPTPEQLKLISSRETFARFGVPYGEDAIAFAASASKIELPNIPPPDFEEVEGSSSRANSRLDTSTTLAEDSVEDSTESVEEVHPETEQSESPTDASETAQPSSTSSTASTLPVHDIVLSPPGLSEPTSPASVQPAVTHSKSPSLPSSLVARAESRASSYTSFATAEESLHSNDHSPQATPSSTPYTSVSSRLNVPKVTVSTSSDDSEGSDDDGATHTQLSTPSTPRIHQKPLHEHENADTNLTLTPATPSSAVGQVGQAL